MPNHSETSKSAEKSSAVGGALLGIAGDLLPRIQEEAVDDQLSTPLEQSPFRGQTLNNSSGSRKKR